MKKECGQESDQLQQSSRAREHHGRIFLGSPSPRKGRRLERAWGLENQGELACASLSRSSPRGLERDRHQTCLPKGHQRTELFVWLRLTTCDCPWAQKNPTACYPYCLLQGQAGAGPAAHQPRTRYRRTGQDPETTAMALGAALKHCFPDLAEEKKFLWYLFKNKTKQSRFLCLDPDLLSYNSQGRGLVLHIVQKQPRRFSSGGFWKHFSRSSCQHKEV